MMDIRYTDWIALNVTGDGYGKCKQVTESMAVAFPELHRVRGHYYCDTWGECAHWWLIDPNWQVVDPTAAQFPSKGAGKYVKWEEGSEEPTGKCPNCGELIYGGDSVCSEKCGVEYVAFCRRLFSTGHGEGIAGEQGNGA